MSGSPNVSTLAAKGLLDATWSGLPLRAPGHRAGGAGFIRSAQFYAIVLLIILWAIHSSWTSAYEGAELPSSMVNWFAVSALGGITIGQEVLVLVLTPALVAGVIADEKSARPCIT